MWTCISIMKLYLDLILFEKLYCNADCCNVNGTYVLCEPLWNLLYFLNAIVIMKLCQNSFQIQLKLCPNSSKILSKFCLNSDKIVLKSDHMICINKWKMTHDSRKTSSLHRTWMSLQHMLHFLISTTTTNWNPSCLPYNSHTTTQTHKS